MPEEGRTHDQREGISRRSLIKRAAATGAVAWAAPTIIDSIASPAAAITGGFPCSYVTIVYTLNGTGPFAIKIIQDATTCQLTNATSGDGTFTASCGGVTYDNNSGAGNPIRGDGTVIPAGASCPFTISGGQVTAGAGVSILFAIVHQGNCPGGTGNFCAPICGPATQITANCGSS